MHTLKCPIFLRTGLFFISLSLCPSVSFCDDIPEQQPAMTPGISADSYLQGGIVGTVVGLGLGHAMEGRYTADSGKGFIFTIGEVAPFAIVIGGSLLEWMRDPCSGDAGSHAECRNSDRPRIFSTPDAFNVATAIFIGFKIWEIADIWNYPIRHPKYDGSNSPTPSKIQFALAPVDGALAVGMKIDF